MLACKSSACAANLEARKKVWVGRWNNPDAPGSARWLLYIFSMLRLALFSALFTTLTALPVMAQESRPAATAATRIPPASPSVQAAPSSPSYYYPPAGSLQPPLSAREVCRNLRSGLSGTDIAQDVRERGFLGGFSQDEAADARAAGASPEWVAALQSGRFTVSPSYAQRQSEDVTGAPMSATTAGDPTPISGRRGGRRRPTQTQRDAVPSSQQVEAERVLANARLQQAAEDAERQRQAGLAATNERAIAIKEREDRQRFENMKARVDWESRERAAYNANGGWYYNGYWYAHRSGSKGHYYYY